MTALVDERLDAIIDAGSMDFVEGFVAAIPGFVIGRLLGVPEPDRHLTFGTGPHFCLGNHLARLNMDIIFTTLLRRIPGITLAIDEPEYRIGLSSRGLKTLAVLWQH